MEVVDLRELALKKVGINGNIIGKFGIFEIEQVFKNNTKDVLEVEYTFPIVETATVVGFEINVGDKVLKGKCKEKGKAKIEYQENIVKGNSAYMMEQKTSNIFKISIGKIDKNEEVRLKINYIDKFEIIDNTIKILIPTLVTPRYNSNVTSKLKYGKVDYTVDFNINIDKTVNRRNIHCSSHKINVIDEEKYEKVEVLDYDLSRDFKLYIELKNELTSNAIISKSRDNKDMIYLSFMPEILDTYEDSEKEYIFIVDVSGSMSGEKINETKRAVIECLKQLDAGDKFNIIAFETQFEAMSIRAIEYNEENMQRAIQYINNLSPLGGTEILNPLKFALYEKESEKIILLFTDGQVGNEDEILNYIEDNINRSRIFPFGIDSNVNSYFIQKLAKVGNGKSELIQPKEKIGDKIIRTFARIQTPLLENVEVNYGKNKVIDEIREENCLFNYEFYNVFAKIEKLEDDIELKGKILNKEYSWKISKESINNTKVDLEVLFAKLEIERLEEYIRSTYDNEKKQIFKNMIIELSEKYNINSKYTSFITVYERKNKILEIPKHQETTLSDKFLESAKKCESFEIDESEADYDVDIAIQPIFKSKRRLPIFNNLDKQLLVVGDKNILNERVDEYYKKFILQNEKSILTYLLYGVYYLQSRNNNFNYNNFLKFLKNNGEVILSNEIYMKLICLIYTNLKSHGFKNEKEILQLLDKDYKKVADTNLKINIELKVISENEIREIIEKDTVNENIDDILWYLHNTKSFIW